MRFIRSKFQKGADIIRKTRDTRNRFTTIADNIIIDVQPAGGGLRFGDMNFIRQNLYDGFMQTKDLTIRQGDIVRRTGENDLAILRIDTYDDHQELTLSEVTRTV